MHDTLGGHLYPHYNHHECGPSLNSLGLGVTPARVNGLECCGQFSMSLFYLTQWGEQDEYPTSVSNTDSIPNNPENI